jgi:hypothetical protein
MTTQDTRRFWIAILTAIAFVIVSNIFSIPERISGMNNRVKELEFTKMNKDDANVFLRELQILQAKNNATWEQYMISNEKDKERILTEIETINEDIKILIGKNRTVTRSVTQQVQSGGKAIPPNK